MLGSIYSVFLNYHLAAGLYDRGNNMQDPDQTPLYKRIFRLFNRRAFQIGICFICAYSITAHADYKKIIEEDFWNKVYPTGGKTFYCDTSFDKSSPILIVSHIYPTALITKDLGCRSERSCLRSNPKYEKIISDLHNMVPVNSFYHFKLKNSVFGNLEASNEANECGIKKRLNIIEPPDRIKGDIARIHFYMHKQYNLPLNNSFLFLKTWDKKDPPSKEEVEKNKRIKEIQGNENPFISDPGLAENLEF
jgi:deoxyribonuclease-1